MSNLHYTWLDSGHHSSGFTSDAPGYYPGCQHRASAIVIPANLVEKYLKQLGEESDHIDDSLAASISECYEREHELVEFVCTHCLALEKDAGYCPSCQKKGRGDIALGEIYSNKEDKWFYFHEESSKDIPSEFEHNGYYCKHCAYVSVIVLAETTDYQLLETAEKQYYFARKLDCDPWQVIYESKLNDGFAVPVQPSFIGDVIREMKNINADKKRICQHYHEYAKKLMEAK